MKNTKIEVSITSNEIAMTKKEEMWNIYRKYYTYTKESFLARIDRNNYYSFYTANGKIVGFTGLRIHRANIDGKSNLLIYFGQTVIDSEFRGKSLIPLTGAKLCMKYWKDLLFNKAYFWADSLTYKAYLVFAKTLAEYYPTYKYQTPNPIKAIFDNIGQTYYGNDYCPNSGTVKKDNIFVNDPTVKVTRKYQLDADISFFVNANPMHQQGHGLITLAPINSRNILLIMKRYIRKAITDLFTKRKTKTPSIPRPIFRESTMSYGKSNHNRIT